MRRTPLFAFAATLVAGALLFLVIALVRGTTLSYTLGVSPAAVAVRLAPGKSFCQEPITAQSTRRFDHVAVTVGTYGRPGPGLAVTVRDAKTAAPLAHGSLAAGYPDITRRPAESIGLDHKINPRKLAVCFTNTGEHSVAFYGAGPAATQPSNAFIEGRDAGTDVSISFTGPHESWASTIPAAFSRARLFRTPHLPGWLYFAGLALLLALGAAAVGAAVRSALPADDGDATR
jgi:hypothetical protein